MPLSSPGLTITVTSNTSFRATVDGDLAHQFLLYYCRVGTFSYHMLGPITGPGTFAEVTNLEPLSHYHIYAVAYDGTGYSLPTWQSIALVAPDSILTSFHHHLTESPALSAALSGGMWTGEVPEGTEPPYAWLELSEIVFAPNMKDEGQYGRIAVHLYAVGADAADRLAWLFNSWFAYQTLEFADPESTKCIAMLPIRYRLVCEMLRHRSGQLIWRAVLNYQILLQKVR